jgi:hypothetical protein
MNSYFYSVVYVIFKSVLAIPIIEYFYTEKSHIVRALCTRVMVVDNNNLEVCTSGNLLLDIRKLWTVVDISYLLLFSGSVTDRAAEVSSV